MRKILLILVAFTILIAPTANAQQGVWRIQWDQAAPSLAAANTQTYNGYFDTAPVPSELVKVCIVSSLPNDAVSGYPVFTCTADLPVLTVANHTVQLSAKNQAGESPKSAAIAFGLVAIPITPSGIRIIPPAVTP